MPDEKMIQPSDPPKNPTVALLLNLLFGFCCGLNGIGYFYIGQVTKGIVILIGFFIAGFLIGFFGAICIFPLILLPVLIACPILTGVDAFKLAKTMEDGEPIGEWEFFWQSGKKRSGDRGMEEEEED